MLSVSFADMLSREELLTRLKGKTETGGALVVAPHIILWYFGENGLKYDGIKYYQKMLKEIIKSHSSGATSSKGATISLYDLTAWKILMDEKSSITAQSPFADIVTNFLSLASSPSGSGGSGRVVESKSLATLASPVKIQVVKSRDYFQWLANIKEPDELAWLNEILSRDEIFSTSAEYKESGVKVGTAFAELEKVSPIVSLTKIKDRDGAKSYSALQYLEAIYLVARHMESSLDEKENIRICFTIPNDETKYYKVCDIEQDIKNWCKLVQARREKDSLSTNSRRVEVEFLSFTYSNRINHRPYNAGKKNVDVLTKDLML